MMDISKLVTSPHVEITYLDTSGVDGEYIRTLREKYGLSQAALGNILNVSKGRVEKWEQGKRKCKGSAAVLVKLLGEKPELAEYVRKVEEKCSSQKSC